MKTPYGIRPAGEPDLIAINDIYNHYVLHSTCTYQEEPELLDRRQQWFRNHGPNHPIIVAETEGQVLGWGSLTAFHPRSAYRHTVENSIYIHHQHRRHGIGRLLLQELIVRARNLGHRAIIAGSGLPIISAATLAEAAQKAVAAAKGSHPTVTP